MHKLTTLFNDSLRVMDPDFEKHTFLLAVSGGADSVALSRMSKASGLSAVIAHCNFHLRGEESDADAAFVDKLAQSLGFPYFQEDFDTRAFAAEHGISIQMAARELRYGWFNDLLESEGLDYILIAHHRDDQVETMLINLVRGTGIRGLCGMPEKNNKVLRPMLDFSRQEIEEYLQNANQPYRTDSSNAETKYLRNSIRHNIIPSLERIDPEFKTRMTENANRFQESVMLLENLIGYFAPKVVSFCENGELFIDITHKRITPALLYELVREYGFNRKQVEDLFHSGLSGKQVYSRNYVLLSDRLRWHLSPRRENQFQEIIIEETEFEITFPLHLKAVARDASGVKISKSANQVELDLEKLSFPLNIRKWRQGDSFRPLGMEGHQKLSDFFINRKLSMREKENIFLLCSGDDIVWVIGMQISDKYKVTSLSKKLLCVQIVN